MECRSVDTWLRDRLRRVVGGRSRVLGRNPLSLLVLRPGPSQDLSRRAGIEGPGRMSEPSAQSGSQDLSRRAGIEGRRPRAAAFSTWAWSQDLSRWAGIEGARDTPPVRPYMSQDLSRPAGEYPEILELRIDGMWGISRGAGIEGSRPSASNWSSARSQDLSRDAGIEGSSARPAGHWCDVARPIPPSGN